MIELTAESGGLALRAPYHEGFLAAFKSTIPGSSRRWHPEKRVWLVDPSVGGQVADLCSRFFLSRPIVPAITEIRVSETRVLDVRYLGKTKSRGSGERSSFGYVDGRWGALFPECVLLEWFGAVPARPGEGPTLFGVLGIGHDADPGTIKSAYRRMAFQWHPDRCREPDAADVFKSIVAAYEVLADDTLRKKYLAGLMLESMTAAPLLGSFDFFGGYRPPLRCGRISAVGAVHIGTFEVDRIEKWDDVVDRYGRVLVTSWPLGALTFEEDWV